MVPSIKLKCSAFIKTVLERCEFNFDVVIFGTTELQTVRKKNN